MKRLIRILLILVLLLVIGGVGLVYSLDSIVAESIRRGGTYALGVETTVEEVDISLGSEVEASITGLGVANPEGFNAERFLGLGTGSLAFPMSGMTADVVSVPEIALSGIELNIERRAGKTNYDVILDHLASLGGADDEGVSDEKETKDEEESGGKRMAIERIVLTDIDATIDLLPLAGDKTRISVHVPEIVIENISNDMSAGEVIGLVIRTILGAVLESAGDILPEDMLQDLSARLDALGEIGFDLTGGAAEISDQLLESGAELLQEGMDTINEEAGDLLKGLGDGAGEALEGIGDEAGEALKGLGGLLKKD